MQMEKKLKKTTPASNSGGETGNSEKVPRDKRAKALQKSQRKKGGPRRGLNKPGYRKTATLPLNGRRKQGGDQCRNVCMPLGQIVGREEEVPPLGS